jgi:hypothetical protein
MESNLLILTCLCASIFIPDFLYVLYHGYDIKWDKGLQTMPECQICLTACFHKVFWDTIINISLCIVGVTFTPQLHISQL